MCKECDKHFKRVMEETKLPKLNKTYMISAKDIRKKCDEDIKQLQDICKHSDSQWMEQCWAPGHFTGRTVLVCLNCEKILETK